MQMLFSNTIKAEEHFQECLKILKNSQQTETVAYAYVLKKYTHALFLNKKYSECENYLKASIQIAQNIFKNSGEFLFSYYRNLLAFYTYTDLTKADEYAKGLINQDSVKKSNVYKYFLYSSGAIKLLNSEYKEAKDLMDKAVEFNLPRQYEGYNLHNMSLLITEMKREYDLLVNNCLTFSLRAFKING
jgi:hypothetical protein